MIQKIPASRLVQSKRQCIKDLVNSKLFHLGECRAILLPVFCQQIKDKLDNNDEVSQLFCPYAVGCVCACAFFCVRVLA